MLDYHLSEIFLSPVKIMLWLIIFYTHDLLTEENIYIYIYQMLLTCANVFLINVLFILNCFAASNGG